VLQGVTFADVADYSGILPDLAGSTTDRDSLRRNLRQGRWSGPRAA
jgi:hypothetical protein